jgi:hypothetical protein
MTVKVYDNHLRGHRVATCTPVEIESTVKSIIGIFGINKSILRNMDSFIEDMWNKYSINIEIVSDTDWLDVANALCDPARVTIAVPEKLYKRIVKKRRSKEDWKALHIFFHELGHLLLGHKPVLHHSEILATKYEDSEWQADYFADIILQALGQQEYKQLSLF